MYHRPLPPLSFFAPSIPSFHFLSVVFLNRMFKFKAAVESMNLLWSSIWKWGFTLYNVSCSKTESSLRLWCTCSEWCFQFCLSFLKRDFEKGRGNKLQTKHWHIATIYTDTGKNLCIKHGATAKHSFGGCVYDHMININEVWTHYWSIITLYKWYGWWTFVVNKARVTTTIYFALFIYWSICSVR